MIVSKENTAQLSGLLVSSTNQPYVNTMLKIVTIKHGKTPVEADELVKTDHEGRYTFYLLEGEYEIFLTWHKNWFSYGKLEIFEDDKNKVYTIQELVDRYDKMHSDEPYWTKERLFKYYALEFLFPVGSIYTSYVNQSPAEKLGGTWEILPSRYLKIADELHPGGFKGGKDTVEITASTSVSLTEDNLPSHTHSFAITGSTDRANLRGSFWDLSFSGQRRACSGIVSLGASYGSGIDNSGGDEYDEVIIDASHNHNINITGSLGATGGGEPFNVSLTGSGEVKPPYITIYMWKRIK